MALSLLTTPIDNTTVLTASIWTTEFNNIYQNALSLISPLTGDLDAGGNKVTGLSLGSVTAPTFPFTGDTNTGPYSSGADTYCVATGGVQALSLGASFVLRAAPEDSRTNTIDVAGLIESTTSGSPAAGIGVGLQFNAESGDENPCPFGRIDFAASDVGAGTEDTYMDVLLRVAGVALETKYRFQSTAATGLQGTFAHAVTADRTWTMPDETVTLVGQTTAGIPTIVPKTADETVNNSTTFQNDDHLLYAMAANTNYFAEVWLLLNAPSANSDFKFQWTVPVACTMLWGPLAGVRPSGPNPTVTEGYWMNVTVAGSGTPDALLTQASTLIQASINGTCGLMLSCIITNGANAGNLQLQWAQNSLVAEDSKLLKNSCIIIRKIQ